MPYSNFFLILYYSIAYDNIVHRFKNAQVIENSMKFRKKPIVIEAEQWFYDKEIEEKGVLDVQDL